MIEIVQVIDFLVWLSCTAILIKYGRLGHSHPATIYIIFHFVIFTWRLKNIAAGVSTYTFFYNRQFIPLETNEIIRAVLLADLAFVLMTIAWIKAQKDDILSYGPPEYNPPDRPVTLVLTTIWLTALFIIPVGIVGLIINGVLPETSQANLGAWTTSSWVTNTRSWAGLAVLILIYWYGFRLKLVIPLFALLFLVALQGTNRILFLIPLLLLIEIYLDRHNMRWPSLRIVGLMLIGLLVFLPLKKVGPLIENGASASTVADTSVQVYERALTGGTGELQDLDYLAAYVTLVNESYNFQFFKPYIALLASPIPRQIWPNKPTQNIVVTGIVTPERQSLVEGGAVMTYVGEAYIDFWLVGVLVIPFLVAYWLGRFYFKAYRANFLSKIRFIWLWLASNLVNYYHSGGMALFFSMAVFMMPLFIVVLAHIFIKPDEIRDRKFTARIKPYKNPFSS